MRKTILRRVEALEKEHRSREQKELSSLQRARTYIWTIVLAYYLGGLKSDEDPWKAYARALNYASLYDLVEARVIKKNLSEIVERLHDAYRRLFANVGLDFEGTPPSMLFDAFVTMVDQLPAQWLNWLRSNLREWCSDVEIAAGSNLPRRLSGDNFVMWRNFRVFTQISDPGGAGRARSRRPPRDRHQPQFRVELAMPTREPEISRATGLAKTT